MLERKAFNILRRKKNSIKCPLCFKYCFLFEKIEVFFKAQFNEVIHIDCDLVPFVDLSILFDDPGYKETGALFWPDLQNHYHIEDVKRDVYTKVNQNLVNYKEKFSKNISLLV